MNPGFISDLAEIRKKHHEEWQRMRKAEHRLERPEEKKNLEYDEAPKSKNLGHVLDSTKIEFLEPVEKKTTNIVNQHEIEEKKKLKDFCEEVSALQDKPLEIGAVIRKRKRTDSEHIEDYEITGRPKKMYTPGALQCIGILSRIGKYRNSSDSEMSCDSDEEIETQKYDLIGSKIIPKKD